VHNFNFFRFYFALGNSVVLNLSVSPSVIIVYVVASYVVSIIVHLLIWIMINHSHAPRRVAQTVVENAFSKERIEINI
jgi:hypothetical protein